MALQEIIRLGCDSPLSLGAWKAFLILPWILLRRPPASEGADSCATLLTERLDRFWQGDIASIYREHIGLASLTVNAKTFQNVSNAHKKRARKVKTLARAGETGRALRAVEETTRTRVTTDVVNEIKPMYPRAAQIEVDSDVELVFDQEAEAAIDMERFTTCLAKELERLPRLSGAGPLGARNEHLVLLAKSSDGARLATVLACLANGYALPGVVEFLCGGLVLPLLKSDGSYPPLTVANVVRRAALKTLVKHRKDDNMRAVGDIQYGISRKCGVDALHKSAQTRLSANPESVIVAIDFEAAFQNLHRNEISRAVAKHAPWFTEACEAWYGGSATHVLFDEVRECHEIHAERGVDQGCPLGSLLFAVTIRDAAQAVLNFARGLDPESGLYFYLDDGYLIVRADAVESVLQRLKQEFGELGVKIKESKLQAWRRDLERLPASLRPYYTADFKVLKRFLATPGEYEHQGLPLQTTQQTLDQETNRIQHLTAALLNLVAAGLDLQTATAMLRAYAGPASQYTLRSCEVSPQSARAYDLAVAGCWSQIIGRTVSAEEPRLWLPLRMGGCGASSAVLRMHIAPWAAWTSVA